MTVNEIKWDFTPYDLDAWNESDYRILFVAAEPNGDNPNSGVPDMGDWFRTANAINGYHSNKNFYNRCRIILSGVLGTDDEAIIFPHFRFFDLKATQGGSAAVTERVENYVEMNRVEVMKYFLSEDRAFGLKPHVVVVLGKPAQIAYSAKLQRQLENSGATFKHVFMPHPSSQTNNDRLLEASAEIRSKLTPVSARPARWYYGGKKDYGWQ